MQILLQKAIYIYSISSLAFKQKVWFKLYHDRIRDIKLRYNTKKKYFQEEENKNHEIKYLYFYLPNE